MKSLIALASVLAFSVAPAFAAEGHVSNPSLAKMGLSGMKAMTDAQGMGIRGLSIAVVTGDSNVNLGRGNSADSQFFAAASGRGTHYAAGASLSGGGTQRGFVIVGTAAVAIAH